eukprot:COSAG05_NODE_13_length_36464_cov_294.169449_26_plen_70_part_00
MLDSKSSLAGSTIVVTISTTTGTALPGVGKGEVGSQELEQVKVEGVGVTSRSTDLSKDLLNKVSPFGGL